VTTFALAFVLSMGAQADVQQGVIVLPLLGDATVSLKQAEGVTAQIRRAITPDVAKLLTSTSGDQKAAEECARDPVCLGRIADVRGADLIASGLVSPAPDGLKVQLVVAVPKASAALRRVDITLQGNDADERRLARLVRSAFNPEALRGAILVTGPEGAKVTIDDVDAGALPMTAPVANVREGDHVVVVTGADGAFRRSVGVVHGDTTEVRAVLIDSRDAVAPVVPGDKSAEGVGTDVIVVGAIGAGLVVLGGVAGTLSLLDALAVEERALKQNLAFPTDTELVQRGNILAWTANGLYVAGIAAMATAGVLYALESP
jgi:hypothetical protein